MLCFKSVDVLKRPTQNGQHHARLHFFQIHTEYIPAHVLVFYMKEYK